jgi:predicted GIY-YIG superfamily endonuclease
MFPYHFNYILKSRSNPDQFYFGETRDIFKRIVEHNTDPDSQHYTFRYRPWDVNAFVFSENEQTAKVVEKYFKNTSFREAIKRKTGNKNNFVKFLKDLVIGKAFGTGENRFEVIGYVQIPVMGMVKKGK